MATWAIPRPFVPFRSPPFIMAKFERPVSLVIVDYLGPVAHHAIRSPSFRASALPTVLDRRSRQSPRIAFWAHPVLTRPGMLFSEIGLFLERSSRGAGRGSVAFLICEWVCFSMFVHAALSSAVRSVPSVPDLGLSSTGGACAVGQDELVGEPVAS